MIELVLTGDDLLQRVRAGDRQALTEAYETYLEPIYQFVRMRVNDRQVAEDITSTVFEKLIGAVQRGKGPRSHLRGWLFKVARNEIKDHYGRRIHLPLEGAQSLFSDAPGPEQHAAHQIEVERMRAALAQLSPEQQEVIILRFDQRLTLQETAEALGRNLNTVKAMQLRALRKLRRIIERGERS